MAANASRYPAGDPRRPLCLMAGCLCLASLSCSHDWDALDGYTTGPSSTSAGGGGAGTQTTSSGTTSSAGGDGGMGGEGLAGGTTSSTGGTPNPKTITYDATVARCVSAVSPDPDLCDSANGGGVMSIDSVNDALLNEPTHGYIRFDFDDALMGATISSVTLQLTVVALDDSAQSGELHQVEAFTLASLGTTVPASLAELSPDIGPIVARQVVEWTLPGDLVAPGEQLYLGLLPIVDDGADYLSDQGANPPRLVIEYQ